jgi:PAS domain-containing protein
MAAFFRFSSDRYASRGAGHNPEGLLYGSMQYLGTAGTEKDTLMALPLRVLILEDRQSDAQLMISELRQADFAPIWERVDTEADFLTHLSPTVEVILCDYTLPQFDAIHALRLVQQQQLDIPFIVVAGTIEDDVAVQAIHMGAADYILKDRMARLGPAVRRALEQQRLRRETARIEEALINSESRLRGMIEKNADGILIVDQQGTIHFLNPAAETLLGRSQGEMLGTLWGFPMVSGQTTEVDIVHQHDGPKSAEMRVVEIDWEGAPAYLASLRDITDRKQAQLTLLERARLAALTAAVGLALNASDTLQDMLHHCAESIVRHLDTAFAGFWTLHPDESFLELQGSAGQSADTHGPLSRVPVGQFMIGLVAQERQPYLTNDLDVSPYVSRIFPPLFSDICFQINWLSCFRHYGVGM